MTTLQTIRQTVIDWIEDESESAMIDRTINSQIRFATTKTFESLMRTADVTPDSNGVIIVPAVCRFIIGIYEQTAWGSKPNFNFYPRSMRPRGDEPSTNRYLYHPYESSRLDEASGIILSGTQGSSTLTYASGTAITADMEGKELVIDGDPTRYLIVTADVSGTPFFEVFPTLRSASGTSLSGTVNPSGMRRYVLTDSDGNVYTDTVTIDYQIDHPPLIQDDDELLIPLERTIALLTVQQFLRQSKYDVDAERLERDILQAQLAEYGTEPTNQQDSAPRDSMFAFRTKRLQTRR